MINAERSVKKHFGLLVKLLLVAAFTVPLLWLYLLDAGSFELMWKGRTFQLFFIWLVGLELILDWEMLLENRLGRLWSVRGVAFAVALTLPTVYVVAANYWDLNGAITSWAIQSHIQWASSMPLSIEYLIFAALFSLLVTL